MQATLVKTADDVLSAVTTGQVRVPGVVAMATDRAKNTYEGAAGVREMGKDQKMTTDTVVNFWSTTKAITGVAAMQLVEEGKLDLDAPAKKYVPGLGDVQVLDGFSSDGSPKMRAPKRDITTRMLLLHTAGFGYDFFNFDVLKYCQAKEVPSVATCTDASMQGPLLFDPGERWEYGVNIDWAGKVVEALRGARLGDVFRDRIFAPLGMTDVGFTATPSMLARRAVTHQREADGSLVPMPDFALPDPPDNDMGGHGLLGSVGEYMKFIRMFLNDGAGEHGRVVKAETVDAMSQDGLGGLPLIALRNALPTLTNDNAEFFPGMPKGWGLSLMINHEDAPTGRPAGSLAWAGLANLYYWIDRKNGIGGFWATQILPFLDGVSVPGYFDFETAVYNAL
jgi:methyl acetate hydrolase